MTTSNAQYDFKLDFIRGIAILLVILTHASEPLETLPIGIKSILMSLGRIGVPLFLFISGALMISKASTLSISGFYKRYGLRIAQFALLLSIVSIATNALHYYYDGLEFSASVKAAIKINNCILSGYMGFSPHLWFMYAIIFCYIVTPFLSRLVHSLSNGGIILLALILAASMLPSGFFLPSWENNAFLAYYVCGYLFQNRLRVSSSKKTALYALSGLIFLITAASILEASCGRLFTFSLHWYSTSFYVLATSVLAWVALKALAPGKKVAVISSLSSCSFGIYLWHIIALFFFTHAIDFPTQPSGLAVSRFLFALLPTWMIVYFLRKVRVVNFLVK